MLEILPSEIPALTIIKVTLANGRTIEGEMNHTAGISWIHTKGQGETYTFDDLAEPAASIEILKTLDQVLQERHERKFGAKAYTDPVTRDDFANTLWNLAALCSDLSSQYHQAGGFAGTGVHLLRRSDQIRAQFDEVADRIQLSNTKRKYMLATACRRARGEAMPSPWELTSSSLDARCIEPPKDSDFHPDIKMRRKRNLKPAHAYETKEAVEWSLNAARSKMRSTRSASKRAQMGRIIARREHQLSKGLYREAIETRSIDSQTTQPIANESPSQTPHQRNTI